MCSRMPQSLCPIPRSSTTLFTWPHLVLIVSSGKGVGRCPALQAIMVDVLMLFPAMVETVFRPPMYGWGLKVYALLTSSVRVCAPLTAKQLNRQ